MAGWNSVELEVLYYVLGWISFFSWSSCFYPQIVLNFRRKSVQGLNFDFVVLNLTKHTSYLIYNASLFFSPIVQRQYMQKFGFDQMIPVAANDVAFSVHAVILTSLTLFQVAIYDRGNQKVSKIALAIVSVAWLAAAACFFVALPSHSWYWLVSCFNNLQIVMTMIKYIPQAFFNFRHKSTVGFSIGYVLFDFLGSVMSFSQIIVESVDQKSAVNMYGNIGKTLLSLVSASFDILFMIQHFILYRPNTRSQEPLLGKTSQGGGIEAMPCLVVSCKACACDFSVRFLFQRKQGQMELIILYFVACCGRLCMTLNN